MIELKSLLCMLEAIIDRKKVFTELLFTKQSINIAYNSYLQNLHERLRGTGKDIQTKQPSKNHYKPHSTRIGILVAIIFYRSF